MHDDIGNVALERFARIGEPACHMQRLDRETCRQVERACARPDLRLLASGVTLTIGQDAVHPFYVADGERVALAPRGLSGNQTLVAYLRHAFEIALWHRVAPSPRSPELEVAAAALAACTAIRFVDAQPDAARHAILAADPIWFEHLRRLMAACEGGGESGECLVGLCARLLPLQGGDEAAFCGHRAIELAARRLVTELIALAAPTERLLAAGGDSRLTVDPRSGLNKYGCSTSPRPMAVTFSSCTASSPSEIAYWRAEDVRQHLLAAIVQGRSYVSAAADLTADTRTELARLLAIDTVAGAEIVLAASGTDCELIALYAALQGHDRDVLSLVMGAEEIGSGSVSAASGRHFDKIAPLVREVAPGAPLEGLAVDRVRVHAVARRDPRGVPVPLATLDAQVAALARAAVGAGQHVLLHVVDSSKTGLRAPSLGAVRFLGQELGNRLTVLIDAAQVRTRSEHLIELIAEGAMVMISGSKFLTGAPFSGALLIPPTIAARMQEAPHVPAGFGAYISGLAVPPTWTKFRTTLCGEPNIGLIMRWQTALAELSALQRVPKHMWDECFCRFRNGVDEALASSSYLERVDAPVGDRTGSTPEWDTSPTIWTFFLRELVPDGRLLDYDEAWEIYLLLNRDVASRLPTGASPAERTLAATPCHVGQPVRVAAADGSIKGALRVAVGARYLSRVAFDRSLGETPEARMSAQLHDVRRALAKATLLARYWSVLRSQSAVA